VIEEEHVFAPSIGHWPHVDAHLSAGEKALKKAAAYKRECQTRVDNLSGAMLSNDMTAIKALVKAET
jgi:hypothetical protein